MNRTTAFALSALLLSIAVAAAWHLACNMKKPEPPTPPLVNSVVTPEQQAEAEARLRAALKHPDTLRVHTVTSNARLKADRLAVEIEFSARGDDGDHHVSHFWVYKEAGRVWDGYPEGQEVLGEDGVWSRPERHDPHGLFR